MEGPVNVSKAQGFGKYRRRYAELPRLCLGDRNFGKARVDCCLYGSRSRWGVFEDLPAGLFFMTLQFHQPAGNILSKASVEMTFEGFKDDTVETDDPLVAAYFPKELCGPPRAQQVINAGPEIGGIGGGEETEAARSYRWMFKATDAANRLRRYTQVSWEWEANKLDVQNMKPTFKVALIVQHNSEPGQPFVMALRIRGKLKSFINNLIFKFGDQNKAPTITKFQPREGTENFEIIVPVLERDMINSNGNPMTGTFGLILFQYCVDVRKNSLSQDSLRILRRHKGPYLPEESLRHNLINQLQPEQASHHSRTYCLNHFHWEGIFTLKQ
jgi:hypothetical protein